MEPAISDARESRSKRVESVERREWSSHLQTLSSVACIYGYTLLAIFLRDRARIYRVGLALRARLDLLNLFHNVRKTDVENDDGERKDQAGKQREKKRKGEKEGTN